jgi:hypothetical protein
VETKVAPTPTEQTVDSWLHCITESADEQSVGTDDFLAVRLSTSIHCHPECGGHPICAPCYELLKQKGLAAE